MAIYLLSVEILQKEEKKGGMVFSHTIHGLLLLGLKWWPIIISESRAL
jgi:hypothetical protein